MRFCLQADGNGLKRMPCRQSPIRVCFVIAYKKNKNKTLGPEMAQRRVSVSRLAFVRTVLISPEECWHTDL